MAMPPKYYRPWSEVDPSMTHGGIADELGRFVAPDLGDNPTSQNRTMVTIFQEFNLSLTAISMHPYSDVKGFPDRALIEESLKVAQTFAERVITNTHTHATKFFSHTHAIPPTEHFKLMPIRYPLGNTFADEFVYWGLGTLVEIAENNRNALHKSLDPTASEIVLRGMYSWKADVMKFWFAKEVAGEISDAELDELFASLKLPNPFYPDVTSDKPEAGDVVKALTGLDVLKWLPDEPDWTVFAQLRRRRHQPERVLQPEASMPTTEDVTPHNTMTSPDALSTGGPQI